MQSTVNPMETLTNAFIRVATPSIGKVLDVGLARNLITQLLVTPEMQNAIGNARTRLDADTITQILVKEGPKKSSWSDLAEKLAKQLGV